MPDSPRIEELKRRVQVDPASIAFAALAEEYRRAGRFEEAIATCQAGLQRHPAYLSARVTLGRALLELKRFDEAREELTHVIRAAPENLAAIRGLAEIHHRRGELPEALEQYRTALNVAKHDAEIEQAVEEISKRVGTDESPQEPAPIAVSPAPAAEEPPHVPAAPADTKRPVPLSRPRLELVTWSPAPPQPEAEPAEIAPMEGEPVDTAPPEADADPALSLAAAFDLMAPPSAAEPPQEEEEEQEEAEAAVEAAATEIEEVDEPQFVPLPDPALPALEAFLGAILREKDALAAPPASRR